MSKLGLLMLLLCYFYAKVVLCLLGESPKLLPLAAWLGRTSWTNSGILQSIFNEKPRKAPVRGGDKMPRECETVARIF